MIIEKNHNSPNASENLSLNFITMPQKIDIEKNIELLKKVDANIMPLAVSADTGIVIGFQFIDSNEADDINTKVITGGMVQPLTLYSINTETNEKHNLGKFLSPKDFKFDETGRLFAFIDGSSNVYIYDTQDKQLQRIQEGRNYYSFDTISWSLDSKKLLINQGMTLDVSSKQLITYAVEAYSPFVKQKYYSDDIYIVQMKNNEYSDMIALYNFENRTFKSLANGMYHDSDNVNLIYTKQEQGDLNVLNMETLESKTIETGSIYKAKIMKSTGEILYTTVNQDMTSQKRYELVKFNPNTGTRKSVNLPTPSFYLSPSEDKIYFIGNYNSNRITVETAGLDVTQTGNEMDDFDSYAIKTTILKMFQLDYNFTGSYDEYEAEAQKLYTNTYNAMPQEALENKLVDFKRFNMPLPVGQKEPAIPASIVLNSISVRGDKASANIGMFFINAIELFKEEESWMITGFSTHPDSKEVKEIRTIVQKHLNDIKEKNAKEALKYWVSDNEKDLNAKQIQIVQDLMKDTATAKIEIGEIELWNPNEPHRVESPQTALEAKVKIIISSDNNSKKYKLVLTRYQRRSFTISSWSIDPLSISQLR